VLIPFEDIAAELSDGSWYRIAKTLNEKRSMCIYWRTRPGTYRGGYPGCNGCNMLRTYVAPRLYRQQFVNDPDFHGWLDLNVQLVSTNYNTAGRAQAFRIVAGVIANGGFQDAWMTHVPGDPQDRCPSDAEVVHGYHGFHRCNGIEFWLVGDDGTYVPLGHVADSNGETIKDLECFSNVGSGASWTEMIDIPAKVVEDGQRQNRAIRLQDENARLKTLIVELSLDRVTLQVIATKGGHARTGEIGREPHPPTTIAA